MASNKKEPNRKPFMGLEWETTDEPYVWCGKQKWKFRQDAYTQRTCDVIINATDTYDKIVNSVENGKQVPLAKQRSARALATKVVMEAALVDFNYDKVCNMTDCGPGRLQNLAPAIVNFIVEGGAPAMQHVQQRVQGMENLLGATQN